jgi:hypothetical protein
MRVILRPTNKHLWANNVVKYKNCYDYLKPYYTRSGSIYTGLTPEDEVRLGDLIGFNLKRSSNYWDSFNVRVGSTDIFLDTEDPLDEIKYLFLKNHKRVKTSIFEHKANADYLLINKDEEAKRENMFNKSKVDAISEFKKMSLTDMRKCLRLFGQNAESVSGEVVENTMFKIIESNPEMFLNKWTNNTNREIEVVLEQAISRNIIRRNKNIYKFGGDTIGYSTQEALDFLQNPKNQDIKAAVLSSIESKDYLVQPETEAEQASRYADMSGLTKPKSVKKPVVLKGPPGMDDADGIDMSKLGFTDNE